MNRVTQAEFARLCNVNRSTVNRWIRAGRIVMDADGLIEAESAQRLRLATESPLPHHQARKAQIEEGKAATAAAAAVDAASDAGEGSEGDADVLEPKSTLAELNRRVKEATLRKQDADAARAIMEVGRMAGTLVDIEDVHFALDDITASLRSDIESLPDRLSGELASQQGSVNGIHKVLEDAVRDLLHGISAQIARRLEALAP